MYTFSFSNYINFLNPKPNKAEACNSASVERSTLSLSGSMAICIYVPIFPFYLLAIAMMLPHGNKILESVNRK